MKCESAFNVTASSIIHLLPASNIFKKDEIILDLFKLNLKLHSILLNLSYYLPPLLFKSQKLTLNYHQLHTIFNTQVKSTFKVSFRSGVSEHYLQ